MHSFNKEILEDSLSNPYVTSELINTNYELISIKQLIDIERPRNKNIGEFKKAFDNFCYTYSFNILANLSNEDSEVPNIILSNSKYSLNEGILVNDVLDYNTFKVNVQNFNENQLSVLKNYIRTYSDLLKQTSSVLCEDGAHVNYVYMIPNHNHKLNIYVGSNLVNITPFIKYLESYFELNYFFHRDREKIVPTLKDNNISYSLERFYTYDMNSQDVFFKGVLKKGIYKNKPIDLLGNTFVEVDKLPLYVKKKVKL